MTDNRGNDFTALKRDARNFPSARVLMARSKFGHEAGIEPEVHFMAREGNTWAVELSEGRTADGDLAKESKVDMKAEV